MGGLALLARTLGHTVTGSDENVYPPMSTLLADQGVTIQPGYKKEHLMPAPDLVIVGNAMTRGRPVVEYMLDAGLPYTSGPQWLSENVLQDRSVIAVAGTHGKTTTASMIAWILEQAGATPGFLIGGVPNGFDVSARVGEGAWFVIEADEYDTAFFDKRSKFVHYRPNIAVLNNLEYDHADIFDDVEAIERQFHHLVRIVPSSGLIVANANDRHVAKALALGCWTPVEYFQTNDLCADAPTQDMTRASLQRPDGSVFRIECPGEESAEVSWGLIGDHNVANALAATLATRAVGIRLETVATALSEFKASRRRLEKIAETADVVVYDDFAHHPTAVHTTLTALRRTAAEKRLIGVIEIRSNSMRMGVHRDALTEALSLADVSLVYAAANEADQVASQDHSDDKILRFDNIEALKTHLLSIIQKNDQIVVMSNGSFSGITQQIKEFVLSVANDATT